MKSLSLRSFWYELKLLSLDPFFKVEFEETLGGMVEAMTEIQGRADSMMEEIKAREVSVMSVIININYWRREQKRSHSV